MYLVEVKTKFCTYSVARRFSEFFNLKKALQETVKYKSFPARTFLRVMDRARLQKRMEELDKFLQFVMHEVQSPEKDASAITFLEFLEIRENTK